MSKTPDMLYHMGGVPVLSNLAMMPSNVGNVYWVDVQNGSAGNTGESFDDPLNTFAAAVTKTAANISWSNTRWAQRDIIMVAPGVYAENITALPHGCAVIGWGYDIRDGQSGAKFKPASGDPVDAPSIINAEFYNLGFESPGTGAAFDAAICNNVLFQNCLFTGAAEATTAVYGFWTSDCVKTTFRGCWFCNADNGAYFTYTDGGDSISYLLMEDCIITGCVDAGIYTHTNLVGPHSVVRNCHISGGGQTLTIGIDDNAGVIDESFNAIEATTAVDGVRSSNGSYGNGVLLT